jgi:hypothetical protein
MLQPFGACLRLVAGRERDDEQRAEEEQRDGEVAADDRGAQQLPHGERSEQHLHHEQSERERDEPAEPRTRLTMAEHPERRRREQQADEQGQQPVEPLDEHVRVEPRNQAALAERPVGTRQPRSRRADDRAHDDQREHEADGREREPRRDGKGTLGWQGDSSRSLKRRRRARGLRGAWSDSTSTIHRLDGRGT